MISIWKLLEFSEFRVAIVGVGRVKDSWQCVPGRSQGWETREGERQIGPRGRLERKELHSLLLEVPCLAYGGLCSVGFLTRGQILQMGLPSARVG